MKNPRLGRINSSFVSIRKAPLQKYATDTNEDEKAQPGKLDIEGLRCIARIVRPINARLHAARGDGHDADLCVDRSSEHYPGTMGGQDHHGKGQQKS